jgi:hypothetical protein
MSSLAPAPPPFVFTLIPAAEAFHNEYELAIAPACRAAGAYVERTHGRIAPDDLLQQVQNLIAKADLVIAEMTSRNESVFYEAGYAHALGKSVILLTENAEDIPFDLKYYPHIVHGGRLGELKPELERRVRHLLALGAPGAAPAVPIEVQVESVWLSTDAPRAVRLYVTSPTDRQPTFWVSMYHEAARTTAQPVALQIGVLAPRRFEVEASNDPNLKSIDIEEGARRMYLSAEQFTILPGSWERTVFSVFVDHPREGDAPEVFAIRIFTADGFADFPFTASNA